MKRAAKTAIVTVLALFVLIIFVFSLPTIIFQVRTWRWESQIKQQQDPEKLRAWAKELLERYKNDVFDNTSVTNFPPIEVRINHEFTLIQYAAAETNGQAILNPTQDYVNVECDFGLIGSWGLKIGETNFVSSNSKDSEWKPGIYFYRFSGG
jgi:hypothetical protein